MSAEIEMLPPQWASSAAQELFDQIKEQIRLAFLMPPWMLSADPRLGESWYREQLAATEHLRRVAARLYSEHTTPVLLLRQKSL